MRGSSTSQPSFWRNKHRVLLQFICTRAKRPALEAAHYVHKRILNTRHATCWSGNNSAIHRPV